MLDDIVDYLTNPAIYVSVYLIVAFSVSAWLSVLTEFPFNYFAMLLPWTPALYAIIKEERRKSRLEVLDVIVRESKKTRHL